MRFFQAESSAGAAVKRGAALKDERSEQLLQMRSSVQSRGEEKQQLQQERQQLLDVLQEFTATEQQLEREREVAQTCASLAEACPWCLRPSSRPLQAFSEALACGSERGFGQVSRCDYRWIQWSCSSMRALPQREDATSHDFPTNGRPASFSPWSTIAESYSEPARTDSDGCWYSFCWIQENPLYTKHSSSSRYCGVCRGRGAESF